LCDRIARRIRKCPEDDFAAVEAIHAAQGLPYEAPQWGSMLASAVLEDQGVIHMAAFLRQTAETYLLVNPALSMKKRESLGELLVLHKELMPAAKRKGLTDVHCWIPPQLGERFGRLLENPIFGWNPAPWPCFHHEVK
jgi:hypothetical protein